ncbi:MAG: hypothetical protein ACTSPI_05995, partial [Candidatus Heimdallarchaeaceae archaeon]
MSIDEYLDNLLSDGSSPTKNAIAKLTRLIENIGNIMIKSTERLEDVINELDARITALEQGGIIPRAPSAPVSPGGVGAPQISSPIASATPIPGTPNINGPNQSVPPVGQPKISAPNISTPTPNASGGQAITPPSLSGPGTPGFANEIASAAQALKKAPTNGPSPTRPNGAPATGPLGAPTASAILEVKNSLKKAPRQE